MVPLLPVANSHELEESPESDIEAGRKEQKWSCLKSYRRDGDNKLIRLIQVLDAWDRTTQLQSFLDGGHPSVPTETEQQLT